MEIYLIHPLKHICPKLIDRLIITRHDGGRSFPIRYVGKMKVEEGPIANTIHNRCGLIKLKKVKWKRLRICTESFHPFITANGDICFVVTIIMPCKVLGLMLMIMNGCLNGVVPKSFISNCWSTA